MIRSQKIYFLIKKGSQINLNLTPLIKLQHQIKLFVSQSKFYRPQVPVQDLLNQHKIQYKQTSNGFTLKYCPFCKKHHNNDPTNLNRLCVHKQTGMYHCFRCQSSGSYLNLKKALLNISVDPIYSQFMPKAQQVQPQSISQTQYFIYKENMKKQQFKPVKEYLFSRGLTQQTILYYDIGCGYELFHDSEGKSISIQVIYFPMQRLLTHDQRKKKILKLIQGQNSQSISTQLVKLKIRGVGKQNKKYMRQYPPGPSRGLFGMNTIKSSDKIVVITEGELDAMSVYQISGMPAISLPQGANSLPDTVLPYLDQFKKIILWMDNDEAGKINLQKFSQKLGISRTCIVSHSLKDLKDANDFLQFMPQLILPMINEAKTIPDQNIVNFNFMRDLVKNRILNQKQFQGVQLPNFNFFNKKVKGIRDCELTVVSGGTGSGKTTLLSQFSIQLSKKKIPVLWGSFQIRNEILISNMLTQFGKINLKKNKHAFDSVADAFAQLPMYYMSFHGSNDIYKVLGTITYAIEKYGVGFVVIDTLQFLLSGQGQGFKKFDVQDLVMSQLRKIATSYKVHIVVVIHPRKTDDYQDIGIHSVYGTSKATQEADNIWIIQNRDGFKIFDVKKNRYDGDIGKVAIGFNKESKSFFELKKRQLQSIFNQQKTVNDIIEERNLQNIQKKPQAWLTLDDDASDGDQPQLQRSNNNKKRY